jgi:hypothetical protein
MLAWLYRQLCEACRRASPTSNLGGCTYLLQIWIWKHIPIGRTHRKPVSVSVARLASIYAIQLYALSLMLLMLVFCFYRHGHIKIRAPLCYLWSNSKCVPSDAERRYAQYSNDLDVLTPDQVCPIVCLCVCGYIFTFSNVQLIMSMSMLNGNHMRGLKL